jgi:hypothetical protein
MAKTNQIEKVSDVAIGESPAAATTAAFDKAAAEIPSDKDEIALLKAKIAQLTELALRPGHTVTSQAVLDVTQPIPPEAENPGGMVRPNRGLVHPTAGVLIFNPNRPTGKHG